jgi:small subunit ribosomal protein S3Ae
MAEKGSKGSRKSGKVTKKKRWYKVLASPAFRSSEIGEAPALEPENMVGKVFRINLMNLTRDMKKQNLNVSFKVTEIKGSDAITELVNYEMAPVNVKRLVKKAKDKIEDSFVCETKDKVKIRVKPLILTRTHTQRTIQTGLRKAARDFITAEAKKGSFSEFTMMIVQNDLQKSVKGVIKKVYPAGLIEIRAMKRLRK